MFSASHIANMWMQPFEGKYNTLDDNLAKSKLFCELLNGTNKDEWIVTVNDIVNFIFKQKKNSQHYTYARVVAPCINLGNNSAYIQPTNAVLCISYIVKHNAFLVVIHFT